MYKITNEFLDVKISPLGAELSSLKTKEREYLWNGNPAYWNWRSPLLFPIVGSLKDNKTIILGKEYHQPKHGFIRDLSFDLVTNSENEIILTNSYSKETLLMYPFKYRVNVKYRLEGKSLITTYQVFNFDSKIMPFNIGAHPGINCPLYPEDDFESYAVHFEKAESFTCPKKESNGLINLENYVREYSNLKKLDLKHEIFDIDTIVIMNVKSDWAALLNRNGKGIKIYFPDFNTFAIWSPGIKKAPLVCLEPWIGYPDTVDSDYDYTKKADLIFLDPGSNIELSYTIEIID